MKIFKSLFKKKEIPLPLFPGVNYIGFVIIREWGNNWCLYHHKVFTTSDKAQRTIKSFKKQCGVSYRVMPVFKLKIFNKDK